MNSSSSVDILPPHRNFTEVEVGDLLFFRTPANPNSDHLLIENVQAFVRGKNGHGASNHVALVVEVQVDASGKKVPIIAHTTVRGEEGTADFAPGYIKEPLEDQIKRESDRSFLIYRPTNKELAKNIGLIAGNEEMHKDIIWEWSPAFKAFFKQYTLSEKNVNLDIEAAEQVKLAQSSICTMFVVQVMKAAAKLTARDKSVDNKSSTKDILGFVHVPDAAMPKFLENHLYSHDDYERSTYLGQEPFKRLENEIRAQVSRLESRYEKTKSPDEKAKILEKINKISESLEKTLASMSKKSYHNEMNRCAELLIAVLPSLEMKTKKSLRETTAVKQVFARAKSMGIFKEDIKKLQKHQEMMSRQEQEPLLKSKRDQENEPLLPQSKRRKKNY